MRSWKLDLGVGAMRRNKGDRIICKRREFYDESLFSQFNIWLFFFIDRWHLKLPVFCNMWRFTGPRARRKFKWSAWWWCVRIMQRRLRFALWCLIHIWWRAAFRFLSWWHQGMFWFDLFLSCPLTVNRAKEWNQVRKDHFKFLGNCPPTPRLSQHFAPSEKQVLKLP